MADHLIGCIESASPALYLSEAVDQAMAKIAISLKCRDVANFLMGGAHMGAWGAKLDDIRLHFQIFSLSFPLLFFVACRLHRLFSMHEDAAWTTGLVLLPIGGCNSICWSMMMI